MYYIYVYMCVYIYKYFLSIKLINVIISFILEVIIHIKYIYK